MEDSIYTVPLLSEEEQYEISSSSSSDDEEKCKIPLIPLEVDKEGDYYPYGLLHTDEQTYEDDRLFKERMICLFAFFSMCFPLNLIFLFLLKYKKWDNI